MKWGLKSVNVTGIMWFKEDAKNQATNSPSQKYLHPHGQGCIIYKNQAMETT